MSEQRPAAAVPSLPDQSQLNLQERFASVNGDHASLWKSLWDDGSYLPWDRGLASPSLIDFLRAHPEVLVPPSPTAPLQVLVPGCGRGYDVLLFASKGAQAHGLELSSSAVAAAQKNASATPPPPAPASWKFATGDFFTADWQQGEDGFPAQFDVLYDYTFLCALDPSQGLREKWAARMGELVKVGGHLICLEFPLYKDLEAPGPPWALREEIYKGLLEKVGFERVAYEKPERYHAAGEGNDMISLWKRV